MANGKGPLQAPEYPLTRPDPVKDDFFGTEVIDPYRWLENAEDPEVVAWTEHQHDLAHATLARLPGRGAFRKRLQEVWRYPKMDLPVLRGERLFFEKNEGLQPQSILYVREGEEERVLIDPNALSNDGSVALMEWEPTADGSVLGYAVSENGEDWRTIRILDVATGAKFEEQLTRVKFSPIAWAPGDQGFFYSRFPDEAADLGDGNREQAHQVFCHGLGTDQNDDVLIYEHPSLRGIILWPQVTHDGRYLIVNTAGDSYIYSRVFVARLSEFDPTQQRDAPLAIEPMYDQLDAYYECIGTVGEELIFLTSKNAPRKQIAAAHPGSPQNVRTIVAASDDVISEASIAGGQIIVTAMHDAQDVIVRYSPDGAELGPIDLPGIGSCGGAADRALPDQKRVFIPFSSCLTPRLILEYNLEDDTTTELFKPEVSGFDPAPYETRQLFVESKDGTNVPVFVTCRRDATLDGAHPTILYGYGGFDVNIKPSYASWLPVWLEDGGVFASAVSRGRGEYGDEWHTAGMFEKKQSVFDDFAAAAEGLIREGYCTSRRLAIEGGSNGDLLVAAAMQRRTKQASRHSSPTRPYITLKRGKSTRQSFL